MVTILSEFYTAKVSRRGGLITVLGIWGVWYMTIWGLRYFKLGPWFSFQCGRFFFIELSCILEVFAKRPSSHQLVNNKSPSYRKAFILWWCLGSSTDTKKLLKFKFLINRLFGSPNFWLLLTILKKGLCFSHH